MRLVYRSGREYGARAGKEVAVDDVIDLGHGELVKVDHFWPPHKPASSGFVMTKTVSTGRFAEYYVGVIGAEWIEREDRGEGV